MGKIKLPESIFGIPWNADLVHQVVQSTLSSRRNATAHTKTRGEVRGGGKKPWKQKGTGRARHGSTRSPIWVGGGVAHGPRSDKNFDRKINKKAKNKALLTVLSAKQRDNEIIFIDALSFPAPKTKEAKAVLSSLGTIGTFKDVATKRKNAAFVALSRKDRVAEKSFSNIGSVRVEELRNINPVDMLQYKYLVIENPKDAIAYLEKTLIK